jgi:hypothetical protein
MGADRGIHVEVAGPQYETLQPLHISKMLAKLAKDEQIDIIIVGKQVRSPSFLFDCLNLIKSLFLFFIGRLLMTTAIKQPR